MSLHTLEARAKRLYDLSYERFMDGRITEPEFIASLTALSVVIHTTDAEFETIITGADGFDSIMVDVISRLDPDIMDK